ncbi:MAG: ATPase [Bacteroidales bacterium]|nr:ATPase [Bacteroidales bacterium]
MFLIADCGSTKCDWAISDGNNVNIFSGKGFNPVHAGTEVIEKAVAQAIRGNVDPSTIDCIYFYGAGCIGGDASAKIHNVLAKIFPKAQISTNSDLLAAGRALFKSDDGIAAILGTGCNSGIYTKGNITDFIPPMGYILGDEGSGASIGKRLVNAIYKREIQDSYRIMFERECMVSYDDIIYGVYRNESPAQFLAGLVPFISDHIGDNIFRNIVLTEFDLFFNRNIIRLNRPKNYEIGFVGSIASTFSEILKDAARFHGLSIYSILQRPIQRLAEYHNETNKS